MIVIQQSVWRADCIAAISIDGDEIQVLPTHCPEYVEYTYKTPQQAQTQYKAALAQWTLEIEGRASKVLMEGV